MLSHHHTLNYLYKKELGELYASFAIRTFAFSLVNIFVPVYLIEIGYSITDVLWYFLLIRLLQAILTIPSAKLSAKIGFKHIMIFSLPILIIYLLVLNTLPQYGWPLFIPAILFGTSLSLFWTGFHIDFAMFSDHDHRSESVGTIRIITAAFHSIGPIVGGLIIAFLSFQALFVTASVVLIAAAIPLLMSKDIHTTFDFKIKNIFKGQSPKLIIAYLARGVERSMYLVIWPIFVFFTILHSYTELGLLTTMALLFSLIFTLLISKAIKNHKNLIFRLGSVLNALVWFIRSFLKTDVQVFVADSVYGCSKTMYMIPFDTKDYDRANRENILKHVIIREMMIALGFVLLFLLLILLGNIKFGLYIGAIASLLILLF